MKKNVLINGFTIIELVVVSAILLVISLAVTDVFFVLLKKSAQTSLINEAKQNGDYALFVMERMVRNATSIVTDCNGVNQNSLTIYSHDGLQTTFTCLADEGVVKIASVSGMPTGPITGYLTSNKITVEDCSFKCKKSTTIAFPPVIVYINFHVKQINQPHVTFRPEDQVDINFETSVVIRNTGYR